MMPWQAGWETDTLSWLWVGDEHMESKNLWEILLQSFAVNECQLTWKAIGESWLSCN